LFIVYSSGRNISKNNSLLSLFEDKMSFKKLSTKSDWQPECHQNRAYCLHNFEEQLMKDLK